MNFKGNQPAIFTAQTYGTKTTVEIDHCDLDLDEVMNAFQTLIVGMGYSNDALKHWVLEKAEEYREDEPEYDGAGFSYSDNFRSHFVSNEEADEDAFISDFAASMAQDEQRYEVNKRARGLITQRLLDFVDEKGAVSYGELHDYYKRITGSNSFSHVLESLRTPYKNRPTQRYLVKEGKRYSDAKYIVKLANPSNWVVVDEYDNYKTFNEAPYGDN
jgi:hypothetical protein